MVVVGGQCRGVGKTSLLCWLLRETPEIGWTALKMSRHRHGAPDATARLDEELDRDGDGDTSRFLRAGARRAFWLRAPGGMGEVPGLIQPLLSAAPLLVESNSIVEICQPDLYCLILDPAFADFKDSARRLGGRAAALITPNPDLEPLRPHQQVWRLEPGYRCSDLRNAVTRGRSASPA